MPLGRLLGIHQPSTPEPWQPRVVQSADSLLSVAVVPVNDSGRRLDQLCNGTTPEPHRRYDANCLLYLSVGGGWWVSGGDPAYSQVNTATLIDDTSYLAFLIDDSFPCR